MFAIVIIIISVKAYNARLEYERRERDRRRSGWLVEALLSSAMLREAEEHCTDKEWKNRNLFTTFEPAILFANGFFYTISFVINVAAKRIR